MQIISLLYISVFLLFCVDSFASDGSVYKQEIKFDYNQNHISMNISPLCTVDGQVSLTLTNVSSMRLYVEQDVFGKQYFDAGRAMFLRALGSDGGLIHLGQLVPSSASRDRVIFESG